MSGPGKFTAQHAASLLTDRDGDMQEDAGAVVSVRQVGRGSADHQEAEIEFFADGVPTESFRVTIERIS